MPECRYIKKSILVVRPVLPHFNKPSHVYLAAYFWYTFRYSNTQASQFPDSVLQVCSNVRLHYVFFRANWNNWDLAASILIWRIRKPDSSGLEGHNYLNYALHLWPYVQAIAMSYRELGRTRRKASAICLRSLLNIYSQALSRKCSETLNMTTLTKSKGHHNEENQQSTTKI